MAGRTRGTTLALGTFTTISAIIGIASLFISSLNWLIRAAILLMVVALTILGARHWVVIERRFNATGRWISNGRGLMPLVAVVVMASLGLGVRGHFGD